MSVLDRPRVDVTIRISGFFRDAFPAQIDLMDSAARAVAAQTDEPAELNPAAARFRAEREALGEDRAGARVFGSKPGAYGAGLQALIDEKIWENQSDLAEAYLEWGSYAYGNGAAGEGAREVFERRLTDSDGVIHNQDNREHDLLDSDDYYQFEGGLSAAITHLKGAAPKVYHNDHSRPERPVIRTLDEEISRVMRSRVVNPKWIAGVMRHGYKGAFEIAATVDYLFAFAATTNAVKSHHFDLVYCAFVEDRARADFIAEHNAPPPWPRSGSGCWKPSNGGCGSRARTRRGHFWNKEAADHDRQGRTRTPRPEDGQKKGRPRQNHGDQDPGEGLVIVHTGKGKGKSSAAFGMIFRHIAHGRRCAVVQFIKGGMDSGEKILLTERFSDLCEFYAMGEGFTWETQDKARDIAMAGKAWEKAKELIRDERNRMVLLDEINIALRYDYIPLEDVLDFLKTEKPPMTHVVLTGRNAKDELIEIADLVTEMELVKHPFRSGVMAQAGVEY